MKVNEEQLARENIALVYLVLKRMHLSDEYLDIGLIGLTKAVKHYDENKGYKFSTYACRVIKNCMIRELLKENACKRKSDVKNISLDKETKAGTPLISLMPSDVDIMDTVILKEDIEKLYKSFDILNNREKFVLALHYGLGNYPQLTFKEIGKILNVTDSMINYIHKRSIEKLRLELSK